MSILEIVDGSRSIPEVLTHSPSDGIDDLTPILIQHLRHQRRRNYLAVPAWLLAGLALLSGLVLAIILLPLAAGLFVLSAAIIPLGWTFVAAAGRWSRATGINVWLTQINTAGLTAWTEAATPLPSVKPTTCWMAIDAAIADHRTPTRPRNE